VGNTQSLSSLNLSGPEQITVLDRTTTADAVALLRATQPFSHHESLSRVAAINGLRCLCPDLTDAKAGLLLENCNNSIGTVIDVIHQTDRPRSMRYRFICRLSLTKNVERPFGAVSSGVADTLQYDFTSFLLAPEAF
jgi:hypothetical protein